MTVHRGRMDEEAMREYLKQKAFAAVVDATSLCNSRYGKYPGSSQRPYHPISAIKREILEEEETGVCYFESNEACAKP